MVIISSLKAVKYCKGDWLLVLDVTDSSVPAATKTKINYLLLAARISGKISIEKKTKKEEKNILTRNRKRKLPKKILEVQITK